MSLQGAEMHHTEQLASSLKALEKTICARGCLICNLCQCPNPIHCLLCAAPQWKDQRGGGDEAGWRLHGDGEGEFSSKHALIHLVVLGLISYWTGRFNTCQYQSHVCVSNAVCKYDDDDGPESPTGKFTDLTGCRKHSLPKSWLSVLNWWCQNC